MAAWLVANGPISIGINANMMQVGTRNLDIHVQILFTDQSPCFLDSVQLYTSIARILMIIIFRVQKWPVLISHLTDTTVSSSSSLPFD